MVFLLAVILSVIAVLFSLEVDVRGGRLSDNDDDNMKTLVGVQPRTAVRMKVTKLGVTRWTKTSLLPLTQPYYHHPVWVTMAYYYWQMSYWKRRGIPGPPGSIFFGNLYDLTDMHKPVAFVLQQWTKRHGKVYGFQEGLRHTLVISDPDMIRELFSKKFDHFHGRKNHILIGDVENDARVHIFEARGARWKRLRTIASSAFSSASLKAILPTVESSVLALMDFLDKKADQKAFDVMPFYKEFTLDVISRIAMGQADSQMFADSTKVPAIDAFFRRNLRRPLMFLAAIAPALRMPIRKVYLAFDLWRKNPISYLYEDIYSTVDKRIEERKKTGIDKGVSQKPVDFIDLFLEARAEQDFDNASEFSKTGMHVTKQLTREEICAQCFVFLVAGFDTTATSLACVTYLLARNPSIQRKLQKEVDQCCNRESISWETLASMKYLDSVMKEGLRMYPLATIANSRCCMKSTLLGEIYVEKGEFVAVDVLTLHFDPAIWGANAHEFRPERWMEMSDRPQAAFLAFGLGPRQCIGIRLAQMEEKLVLAHLIQRFEIVATRETEKSLALNGSITFAPDSVTIQLRRRVSPSAI